MRYKVYDTVNRQDITDDPTLILKPVSCKICGVWNRTKGQGDE